ncbi:MAG: AbrB family transcriptional regulator [Thiolinea sp.]
MTLSQKHPRTALQLEAGTQLEFTLGADGKVIITPISHSVKRLKGCLPKPAQPVSLEAMEQAIAEGAAR